MKELPITSISPEGELFQHNPTNILEGLAALGFSNQLLEAILHENTPVVFEILGPRFGRVVMRLASAGAMPVHCIDVGEL